ncbi:monocarboxylate transporter 9-like [Ostrea edulis]|uniref:monocarboxylate transporter 9-like n=1 Tax=Ostrea edulis TaxID=37623 RepID=UPI0024AEF916|nr:monocarboxylate transporter 9-like [Ostrea edulis]XP_056005358.1 monocarboxylate transporter 9-like [Ostrea edulis]XP_056005360.1 monocarboxylate transporter 9-like [Ostrea edulis]XP_056005361.1 monocarboxylate transporter 9-like [Ostrea edulis]XP_056005362.1 monocarboxylate transporter 9-like [Ostrea edulis]XP_056005363.1 monocarboxylate transporter 9-like [Ostrea edulis]XP_056005364.1 monocarboxylate transporter 9-like [Ostrea edulis]XP_056005365.1 monocarboxylate transporter 9-like [Os
MGKGRGKGKHGVGVDSMPTPPDGGWGWFVVLGSFLLHVVADGIVYSFGVFYMEFLTYFKGGKGETAWVGSLVPGVTLLVGPLASALTNRYGCRSVTIVGAIIAAVGFILSLFAPNIYYLFFSFGILSGLGFGLMYLPAIVSVSHYFESKRSFATGIAVCGSGIGTFIFAPVSKLLVDEYTWKGAVLIEAGIILNCILFGALFRPLVVKHENADREYDEEKGKQEEKDKLMKKPTESNGVQYTDQQGDLPDIQKTGTKDTLAIPNKHLQNLILQNDTNQLFRSEGAINNIASKTLSASPSKQSFNRQTSTQSHLTPSSGPMYRKDIFYSGSLINIPQYRSNPNLFITSITSLPDVIPDDQDWCLFRCLGLSPEMRDAIRQMMDFSLLKDVIFLLFTISNICTSIGFNMPYIYLPDRAHEVGINKTDATFLVSVIGIANTIGRVVFGWMADKPWVNRLMLYNTSLFICGIATALSPLSDSYPFLIGYAAVFGAFIGVYVGLTSVVLVDLLGLSKLTNAFGLLLMFQGLATFIGPPIAGWLYDGTGSYDISFHVAGTMVAISGAMLYAIPFVQKCLGRKPPTDEIEISAPQEEEMKPLSA